MAYAIAGTDNELEAVTILVFNGLLFSLTTILGFALFGIRTSRLARAFRRLLGGTRPSAVQ